VRARALRYIAPGSLALGDAKIKTSKEHLTSEGFEKILKIKSGMKSTRRVDLRSNLSRNK